MTNYNTLVAKTTANGADHGKSEITSLELLNQINFFRNQIETKKELKHNDLLKIIRDEFEEEINEGKLSPVEYLDKKGENRPMFNLTISQAKQVLVRESKAVRKAVIQKLETLELEFEAKPIKSDNLIDISQAMANQVLQLVEKVKQEQQENQQKQALLEAKQEILESVVTMKAKQFKTVNAGMKADIGKEINLLTNKLFFKQANGSYKEMHLLARDEYQRETDNVYLGAKNTSYESKVIFLDWLRKKANPNMFAKIGNTIKTLMN